MANNPEINIDTSVNSEGIDDFASRLGNLTDLIENLNQSNQTFSKGFQDVLENLTGQFQGVEELLKKMGQRFENIPTPPEPPKALTEGETLQRKVRGALEPIGEEIAGRHFRGAENALLKAEYNLEQLKALDENNGMIGDLTEELASLRKELKKGQEVDRAERSQSGFLGSLVSAGGSRVAGPLAPLLRGMKNPFVLGSLGTIGGAFLAKSLMGMAINQGTAGGQEAEDFINVGRRMGTSQPLIESFLESDEMRTRGGLKDLRYTTTQAGQFLSQFGMPMPQLGGEGLFDITRTGLDLARNLGLDPSTLAETMKEAAMAGLPLNDPDKFGNIVYRAVRDGTEEGVGTSETLGNISQYLEELREKGLTADMASLLTVTTLLDRFAETESRTLQGRAGAKALNQIMGTFGGEGNQAMEGVALYALGLGTQQGLPSAQEMGLEGDLKGLYTKFLETSPGQAAELLRQMAVERKMPKPTERLFGGLGEMGFDDPRIASLTLGKNISMEQFAELTEGGKKSILEAFKDLDLKEIDELGNLKTTIEDVQATAKESYSANLGLVSERIKYLDAEGQRLISLGFAHQTYLEQLKDLSVSMDGEVAKALAKFGEGVGDLAENIENFFEEGGVQKIKERATEMLTDVLQDAIRGLMPKWMRRKWDDPERYGPSTETTWTAPDGTVHPITESSVYRPSLGTLLYPSEKKEEPKADFGDPSSEMPPYHPASRPISTPTTDIPDDKIMEMFMGKLGATKITSHPSEEVLGTAHRGFDFRIGERGESDPVYNPFPEARVLDVGKSPTAGKHLTLETGEGEDARAFYMAHFQDINVKKGDVISGGEMLGMEGTTGSKSTGYHLHMEPVPNKGLNPLDEESIIETLKKLFSDTPKPVPESTTNGDETSNNLSILNDSIVELNNTLKTVPSSSNQPFASGFSPLSTNTFQRRG